MDFFSSCETCYELEPTDESIICANLDCPNDNSYCRKCVGKYIFKIRKRVCPCVIIGYNPLQRNIILDLLELRPNAFSKKILRTKQKLAISDMKHIFGGLCHCNSFEIWGRSRLLKDELSSYIQLMQTEWKTSNVNPNIQKVLKFKTKFKSPQPSVYMCRNCCERC